MSSLLVIYLVLLAAFVQIVQALSCVLALTAEQGLSPLVHLQQKSLKLSLILKKILLDQELGF